MGIMIMVVDGEIEREPSTARTRKLKAMYNDATLSLDIERARYFTESWKKTDGQPIEIRRALGLKHVPENITPAIFEGELLVGNLTSSGGVDGARKLAAFLRALVESGGYHVQFDVVSEERRNYDRLWYTSPWFRRRSRFQELYNVGLGGAAHPYCNTPA